MSLCDSQYPDHPPERTTLAPKSTQTAQFALAIRSRVFLNCLNVSANLLAYCAFNLIARAQPIHFDLQRLLAAMAFNFASSAATSASNELRL